MDIFIVWALYGLFTAVIIGVCASILGRIGYSRWYSLLLAIPALNLLVLIVIVAKQWPVERELARLRLIAGESADIDADIESVISCAISHEQKRQWDRAISLYNFVAEKSNDARVKKYAAECAQRLTDN